MYVYVSVSTCKFPMQALTSVTACKLFHVFFKALNTPTCSDIHETFQTRQKMSSLLHENIFFSLCPNNFVSGHLMNLSAIFSLLLALVWALQTSEVNVPLCSPASR